VLIFARIAHDWQVSIAYAVNSCCFVLRHSTYTGWPKNDATLFHWLFASQLICMIAARFMRVSFRIHLWTFIIY